MAIDIPPNAQPGSRWGALLVTTDPAPGNEGTLVRTLITATLLLRVGGETIEEMAVESFSVSEVSETTPLIFSTRFRNTGQVHLKPQGTITVRNVFGSPVTSVTLPGENVLPGTTRKMEAKRGEGLGFGRYTAWLEATYGLPEKQLSAETHFWVLPWKENGPALSVFLASLAIGMFVIWKRKNVRAAFRKDQEDREEKGGKMLGHSGD